MKGSGAKFEIRTIPANRLTIDHTYQRDQQPTHYKNIARELDFDKLGILVVSERKDGTLVVIDGQHRVLALREQRVDEWEVVCRVYSGLSISKEAELYRALNKSRRITAWDDFKAGLTQGDHDCLTIQATARQAGWEVSKGAGEDKVCCVAAMRAIYAKEFGRSALQRSLEDARAAWGGNPIGVEKSILTGLSLVHLAYDGHIDRAALVKKLSKTKGGPAGILAVAKQMKDMKSASIARLCAEFVVEKYNSGRRAGRLDPL